MSDKNITKIIIAGATGRMGREIAQLAAKNPDAYKIVAAISKDGNTNIGKDLGSYINHQILDVVILPNVDDISNHNSSLENCVLIDFSSHQAAVKNALWAANNKISLLLGTTAISEKDMQIIEELQDKIPILIAPNTSIFANILSHVANLTAQKSPSSEVEIVEIHHNQKKDSPSGTAKFLAKNIALSRNKQIDKVEKLSRVDNPRKSNEEIGVYGIRGGNTFGEHTVYFFNGNERLEMTHRVYSREVFAQGALFSAQYLAKCKAGLYTMNDVLNI